MYTQSDRNVERNNVFASSMKVKSDIFVMANNTVTVAELSQNHKFKATASGGST